MGITWSHFSTGLPIWCVVKTTFSQGCIRRLFTAHWRKQGQVHSLLCMNLAGQNYSLYSRTGLSVEAGICVLLCAMKSGDFKKDTPVSRASASYIFRTPNENGTHFLSFIYLFIFQSDSIPWEREETGSFLYYFPGELCVGNESCCYSYHSKIIVSECLLFLPLAFQS